jgi:hypothetical protein
MIDLPKKMEWYEGWNWCASVMNFEEEELCAKPTNLFSPGTLVSFTNKTDRHDD